MGGGKPENPEKNPLSKDENQQQTQPTCDAGYGNRTRATVAEANTLITAPFMHPHPPSVRVLFTSIFFLHLPMEEI